MEGFSENRSYLGGRLVVGTGDITRMSVDAIVNAANSTLLGGGGVDGAIHAAGGPEILEACREIRRTSYQSGLPAGEAVATTAGRMPAGHVIHTVGPVWHGGGRNEEKVLGSAYLSTLRVATEIGAESVAFPAISTGVYGFPKTKAARVVYDTISNFVASHDTPTAIYLVFFSQPDCDLFVREAG